jgi:diaminopimelate decarboxylase
MIKTICKSSDLVSQKNVQLAGRLSDTYDIFPLSNALGLSEANVGRYVSFYDVRAYSVAVIIKTTEGEFKLVRKETSYEQLFMAEAEGIA